MYFLHRISILECIMTHQTWALSKITMLLQWLGVIHALNQVVVTICIKFSAIVMWEHLVRLCGLDSASAHLLHLHSQLFFHFLEAGCHLLLG